MIHEGFHEKQDTDEIFKRYLKYLTPCVNPGTMFLPTLPTIAHNPNLVLKYLKATKKIYNSGLDYGLIRDNIPLFRKILCKNPPGWEFDPERRRRLVRNLNRPGR